MGVLNMLYYLLCKYEIWSASEALFKVDLPPYPLAFYPLLLIVIIEQIQGAPKPHPIHSPHIQFTIYH